MLGIDPENLSLRKLLWMAIGRAELLGGTSGPHKRGDGRGGDVIPYNPAVLEQWAGGL